MGRLGHVGGPFWMCLMAVLDISKIYGHFGQGHLFMGLFGVDPVCVVSRVVCVVNQLMCVVKHLICVCCEYTGCWCEQI